MGWRAGGAPHVDDLPDTELDIPHDLLGWHLFRRDDARSCLQHLVHLVCCLGFGLQGLGFRG